MEGVWFFASTKVGREPSKYMRASYQAVLLFLFFTNRVVAQQPLFRVIDIDVGATEHVRLSDGKHATVKLLSIGETRDKLVRQFGRLARRWRFRAHAPPSSAGTIVCQ